VQALDGCYSQLKIRSVHPNTGNIVLNGVNEDTGESYSLLDEIDACIDKTLQALRSQQESFQVVGVGFSTFVMNLVGVDRDGNVVGEEATISYACNSPQVAQECKSLKSELGEERQQDLFQKTGAPIHSAYALVQLRSLYSNSECAKEIYRWQTLASLCRSRWRGVSFVPISYSEASWTGLFNFRTCVWEQDALDLLPFECRHALPNLADYCDTSSSIPEYLDERSQEKNPYWERWPELQKTCRLFLGLGDGACANIGSKCSTPKRIAVTVGTSAAARVCLPLPCSTDECDDNSFSVPKGLFCYRVDKSHVLMGGALTDGGSVVEWACNLMNLNTDEAFQRCMEEVQDLTKEDIDAPSLTVVPFLSGERSTGYRDGATGCVMGLTRETTPARFMKACLESVMLRIKAIVQLVDESIKEHSGEEDVKPYIVVSGNAMEANKVWRQMLANASGMEVQFDADISAGTSRGVARLISVALDTKDEAVETTSDTLMLAEEPITSPIISSPRKEATELYWARATEAQNAFVDAVSPLW
jgi:gluconokinase